MLKYTCPCCFHKHEPQNAIMIICPNCNWIHSLSEETNKLDAFGPNGMTLEEYQGRWKRAGKPQGIPWWEWKEEIN